MSGKGILLLDTCGEQASLALTDGQGSVLTERELPARTASRELLPALRAITAGMALAEGDLAGIGVVHGPGSFTGVRIGLALAKGMCEAAGLPLALVSRLHVLANKARGCPFSAMRAGQGALYVRGPEPGGSFEAQMDRDAFERLRGGAAVATDSEALAAELAQGGPSQAYHLTSSDAALFALAALGRGGVDVATADALYLRDEATLYRQPGSAAELVRTGTA